MKPTHLKLTTSDNRDHHVQLVIFICLGFLLYFKTFGHVWTFDDYFVILKNQDLQSLKNFMNNMYPGRPLRELSFMIDYNLFGLNPKYWHIQNILIHSINAWVFYVLLMNLCSLKSLSWLSSLIFIVHPLNVEVIAQTSHRKDSLCLLFILISFYLYVLFRNNMGIFYICASLCAFTLSLLAKQTAFVFPLIIISYEILFYDGIFLKKIKHKCLLCTVLVVSSAIIFFFLYIRYFDSGSRLILAYSNVVDGYSISKYFVTLISAWGFIVSKFFWPFGLAVNYAVLPPEFFYDYRLILFALFAILIIVAVYYAYFESKLLLLFISWFFVFFIPTSNVFPFAEFFVADRYMYIPSVGLCIAVAFLVTSFFSKIYIYLSFIIISLLALATFNQIDVWKDNLSLWTNSLKYNQNSVNAIMNVAICKYFDNDDQFLENIQKAISLNPHDPFPYNALADFYYRKNESIKAIENYEKFLKFINKRGVGMYKIFDNTARDRLIELKKAVNK